MVRAPARHAGGRRFESYTAQFYKPLQQLELQGLFVFMSWQNSLQDSLERKNSVSFQSPVSGLPVVCQWSLSRLSVEGGEGHSMGAMNVL